MKKSKLTAEEIEASAWEAALTVPVIVDEIPAGWFTAAQLSKKLSKGHSTIGRLLRSALSEGRAIKKEFRVAVGAGSRPVPHYKMKKQ